MQEFLCRKKVFEVKAEMKTFNDMTTEPIKKTLILLALPIMGASFFQLAYGIVDMLWIGKLGSRAVAAVGSATFFINLGFGLNTIIVIGTGIKVAHRLGSKNYKEADEFINTGFLMNVLLFLGYFSLLFIFRNMIVKFFNFNDTGVEEMAKQYLIITGIGTFFKFSNFMFISIFNSFGDSKTPFKINCIGVIMNIFLDPLFIFVFNLGVFGAALATMLCEGINSLLFYKYSKKYFNIELQKQYSRDKIKDIFSLGFPNGIQRVLFTAISIVLARMVAQWGASAIAAQKIALQIEAVSYLTIGGLQGAVASFIGQNFGAKKTERIAEGHKVSMRLSAGLGIITTLVFVIFAKPLMRIFIDDEKTLEIGVQYLRIVGLSQVFMCLEIVNSGAFSGIGKPKIASIIGITFTSLRIPIAFILAKIFGINGIWMTISGTTVVKGILSTYLFLKEKKYNFRR